MQLRDLGLKQSELISTGEMTSLLRLLSAKNQAIVAIQALEQELHPFHAQDPEQRAWHSERARAQCAKQAEECHRLLAEVMQMERDNEEKMTTRRDEVANQLQTVQAASTARRAYHAQSRMPSQSPHTAITNFENATNEPGLDLLSGT